MGVVEFLANGPLTSAALAFLLYVVLLYTYRLTLHPLARFPGSKIAAVTLWYEFYHDFFAPGGQYIWVIRDMHDKYGPIVRVSPDELHINDPSFLPELMPAGKNRRDKYSRAMQVFGFAEAGGATVNHDLHRMRRGAMSKMFSKESVRKLEPIMKNNLEKLFERLRGFKKSGEPINLLPMFGAFTNDLISEYAYGFNSDWLGASEFNAGFFHMIDGFHDFGALALQFKWFMPLMNMIPQRVLLKLNPGMSTFVEFKQELLGNIDRVEKSRQDGQDQKTVFDEIFDSKMPEIEKRRSRLLEEAQNISIAGTETTSWTLSVLTFYLLSTPRVLDKLRAELKEACPNPSAPLSIKEAEQLPYLSAVITEGLRISMGTSNRQTRINPDDAMVFLDGDKTWRIPAGTPVGMATPLIHLNPAVFPNPLSFEPERFINDPRLKRSLMSFSQGSRQCLGMQLAYAELYLVVSGIWRRFKGPSKGYTRDEKKGEDGDDADDIEWGRWELFETDRSDVEMVSDRFVPYPKAGSKGIRIVVTK